jgi:hypothetical protein
MLDSLGVDPVADLVLHHHERWDGAGYPDGLAGEEIPLGARIIFVTDAYDAMTSDRIYRPSVPERRSRRAPALRGHAVRPGIVAAFTEELGVSSSVEVATRRETCGSRVVSDGASRGTLASEARELLVDRRCSLRAARPCYAWRLASVRLRVSRPRRLTLRSRRGAIRAFLERIFRACGVSALLRQRRLESVDEHRRVRRGSITSST